MFLSVNGCMGPTAEIKSKIFSPASKSICQDRNFAHYPRVINNYGSRYKKVKVKVNQSCYRPGVVQRVLGI